MAIVGIDSNGYMHVVVYRQTLRRVLFLYRVYDSMHMRNNDCKAIEKQHEGWLRYKSDSLLPSATERRGREHEVYSQIMNDMKNEDNIRQFYIVDDGQIMSMMNKQYLRWHDA